MDARIERYLDGELSEPEVAAFERQLAADPALEAELRSWERMLERYVEAWAGGPSAGFGDRLETAIADAAAQAAAERPGGATTHLPDERAEETWAAGRRLARDRSRPRGRTVLVRLAAAAALAACFGLGLLAHRIVPGSGIDDPAPRAELPDDAGSAAPLLSSGGGPQGDRSAPLVPVRFVYVPRERESVSVAVAGSFNGWDPGATPLKKVDGVWTAVLLLPAGSHEYMFVLDGQEWRTDPLALHTRNDGFGRENAVIDLAL